MKRSILLLVMVVATASCYSQLLPKKNYMRLQGYLNDQIEVIMNLVKVNDSLYADFCLSATSINANEFSRYYGARQVAGGRIAADGSFTIRAPFDPQGLEIKGKFITRQTVTGTWGMEKGGAKYRFSLTENYPQGSHPLSVWFQSATRPLVSKGPGPRAYIEQCLVVPTESGDPVASDTVRKMIMDRFASGRSTVSDPQLLINALQQSYFGNYIADNLDLYKQMADAGSLSWDLYKLVHIVYNDNFLLSFYIDSYAFTGGAHGLGAQDYTVIQTKTGKAVSSSDIFVDKFETPLSLLLTARLKKMEKLQPSDKLSEKAEYFVDEIPPNSNFYITANGIGFLYNHYEIAPYSHGFTDIFLTFDELAPVMKRGGVLEPLLK
jgi:hypothetical protein